MTTTNPPPHARRTHYITTPRLILRTARASDAQPFTEIGHDPLNNPFGGVVAASISPEEQAARLVAQTASTAEGKNAFLVVILKPELVPEQERKYVKRLKIEDGYLMGMTGFNSFPIETDENGREIVVGDTGVLIDHHFARRGLALEALQAVIELGFEELGVGEMFLETNPENLPFKSMMKALGLGNPSQDVTRAGEDTPSMEEKAVAIWRFDKVKWAEAKETTKLGRKWYLNN